jgi:hypothetical protein
MKYIKREPKQKEFQMYKLILLSIVFIVSIGCENITGLSKVPETVSVDSIQVPQYDGGLYVYEFYEDSIVRYSKDKIVTIDGVSYKVHEVANIINVQYKEIYGQEYKTFNLYWVEKTLQYVKNRETFGMYYDSDNIVMNKLGCYVEPTDGRDPDCRQIVIESTTLNLID